MGQGAEDDFSQPFLPDFHLSDIQNMQNEKVDEVEENSPEKVPVPIQPSPEPAESAENAQVYFQLVASI